MYPRTNYEMTQADYDAIIAAIQPVPYMVIGGVAPRGQQERANDAWAALGRKMGFDHMTVQPGNSKLQFSAVPSETEEQQAERKAKEVEAKRLQEITTLEAEIAERQIKLHTLSAPPQQRDQAQGEPK